MRGWQGVTNMAAASSGEKERERMAVKNAISGEVGGQLGLETGGPPREGTKEHMNVVERYLDELTYCGSTVNDLELQLSSVRATYRRTLGECKASLEETRKRLGSCIAKSQPFIDVWRRARQVQEESNKAAARFDKASSQHAASKEMIRVTEQQRLNCVSDGEERAGADVNHALLEVFNHATRKVVETERERRESEVDHRRVLERCNAVLEEYRSIEKKLRPHIIKSRPFFEERWRCSQRLNELRGQILGLEHQLQKTKRRYADTLRYLDRLNSSIHQQRSANSVSPAPQLSSEAAENSDSESVQSWQMLERIPFTGSTGSLPSIGSSLPDELTDEPIPDDRVTQLAKELVRKTLSSALARVAQHTHH